MRIIGYMENKIRHMLQEQLRQPHSNPVTPLHNGLRLLAKWRSARLQKTVLDNQGTMVMQGPLAGMDFLHKSTEGCHIAKLLGCYEQPLQPFIEQAIQRPYATVLNIGCAEGYYAVGMARRMPNTQVLAHDLNPLAQSTCAELARKNGVADRVHVGGLFSPGDLAAHAGASVLLMCDIEGAEKALLDPQQSPALKGMDIVVESHECLVPGITQLLMARFHDTHDTTLVQDDGQRRLEQAPAWFLGLPHLDQLLAVWEWRSGPTPWLVMRTRTGARKN